MWISRLAEDEHLDASLMPILVYSCGWRCYQASVVLAKSPVLVTGEASQTPSSLNGLGDVVQHPVRCGRNATEFAYAVSWTFDWSHLSQHSLLMELAMLVLSCS
jgi:hypothetical protein